MRAIAAVLFLAGALVSAGCESFFNPMPTTEGSRITERLQSLPQPDPDKVKAVTVYRFDNKTGFPHGLAISYGMTEQLITALVKTHHFRVVERAELGDVMTERRLQGSGEATGEAGATKLKGAELIFAGAVTELSESGGGGLNFHRHGVHLGARTWTAQVGLDMRIVDPATGDILDAIDVRRKVRKTGMHAGAWGVGGNIRISNAMDLAIREVLEEAVYQLVTRYGAN